TGVYKALEVNGEELDQERMEVAQEELEATSDIAEGEDLDEEESNRLDAVIVEMKQQLADIKDRTDNLAKREEIEQIINDAFEKYQQTSAIDSEQVKKQLNEFANNLGDRLGDAWKQAEESGLLDRIANFFRDIINSIANLFN